MKKSVDSESGKYLHNQWKMNKDRIDVRNPAWNTIVWEIAMKAARDLGIKPDAGAVKVDLEMAYFWAVGVFLPLFKEYISRKIPGVYFSLT